MEISSDDRVELSIVEHLPPPPSQHNGGTGSVEVAMEEDHLWPTKDGPLPIFLKFENVEYKVKLSAKNPLTAAKVAFASHTRADHGSSSSSYKHILKGIGGSVDPGEILALMGPSGSGKTTLLKILGGRLGGSVKGQITYNDTPYSPCLKRRIGFVTQDDVLFPQLTVEETLVFAAFLRLPARMSKQQKRDRVDAIIAELNLERCRHTKIGGSFVRGVSGGERKRTSIGYEILVDPSLLLLDEPTSGLDSTSASKLIVILQRLAKSSTRRTIITTIHQPSSRMFHMFDKLLLISEGHAIYHGKARDCMHHFSSLGFTPEIPMNPAEFLLDLATGNLEDISVPELLRDGSPAPQEFRSRVVAYLQLKYKEEAKQQQVSARRAGEQLRLAIRMRKDRSINWFQQFVVLSRRTFRERAADYLDKMRLAQAVGVALLLGLLWWKSKTGNEAQLRDQVGLIFYICIFWTSSSLFGSVYVFPFEKLYLVKERKADMYRLSAYYASSTLCDAVPHVVYPVLFMAILYFMADLRRTVPCFFLTLFATLLIVFTSQGTGELLGAAILSVKRAGVMASLVLMLFLLTGGYYVQHIPKFIRWLRMAARARYHLLEAEYEESHRGRILSETQALLPLRIRGHKVNTEEMVFDERYTPYLRRANLIGFVTMIERGLPTYNSVALTALVDRWHVETHTFHLPCGEMTITLQDMAMLTALPISGWAVTRKIQADRFRDMVEELLGVRPPEKIAGTKGSKTGGLRLTWIEHHFGHLPLDANEETVSRYARAYVMYVFGKVLFSDSRGSDVSWMYLPLLRDWDDVGRYSWGSAGLAYLYRQLDEACRRSKGTSNMGGCVLVLQVWSWLRFPIGRPTTYAPRDWEYPEEDRAPTVVYLYEDVSTKWGPSDNLYRSYIEDFDSLRRGQVTWQPYTVSELGENFNLNPMCTQDMDMWTKRCPLICFYAVEYHLPHRVGMQFGKLQELPPEHFSTSSDLHKLDRRKNKSITDWEHHHREYIQEWNDKASHKDILQQSWSYNNSRDYEAWLQKATQVHLKPSWTSIDCLEEGSDEPNEFDEKVRMDKRVDHGPMRNRVAGELVRGIKEAEVALRVTLGSPAVESTLRKCLEKLVKRSRSLVSRLGCRDPTADMTSLQPSPPTSGGSGSMYNSGDGTSIDSDTPLSMFRGASSSQTVHDGPEPSQSQGMPRRGSRARRAPDITTPGTDALKPRRKKGVVKKRKAQK